MIPKDCTEDELYKELDKNLNAKVGKWALAIIGTIVAATVSATLYVAGLDGRIRSLESWRTERQKPIDDYYSFKETLAATLADIKATQRTNTENIEKILNKLDGMK